ncbi:methyl-accepting chemotaxis protein [Desulfovibrio psychrotolerans]|uniref:Methyl-accepting chemotaxis protein n=1 Tax=Desulfovibrio psychrotolerans TaxID=415242 RepID=A0A7J0BVN2_9BACT|nr:methyl-accepting chemotaxis protein [Desulfovibrio psychrotolerans]GFM37242.1 hypothetical protein DSM19430T_19260 [Desulfovibrio psychrotolerans]
MTTVQKATTLLISGACAVLLLAVAIAIAQPQTMGLWLGVVAGVSVLCLGAAFFFIRSVASGLQGVRGYAAALADGQVAAVMDAAAHNVGDEGLISSLEGLATAFRREMGLKKGIIEGLPTPFLLVDTKERALYTNQACMDMLEIDTPPEKQFGRTLAEIFYNDPTRKTAVGQSIENGKVFQNLQVTIKGHKGGERHVLANVYPLYDMSGTCIGGFCLYLDMTELKRKEEELCAHNELIIRSADRATDISNGLASAAEELSAQVEQSSVSIGEQQARTQEVSHSMEQMNSTVIEVAKSAGNAAELAENAKSKAQEGAAVVNESRRLIDKVYDDAVKLKDDMNALGVQAENIGAVVSVINDIADQTNLLALNAAIEAARAGEYGRGFAVVADEVRKLAEKTMQATKEVTDAIGSIQQSTQKSMVSSENAAKAISENTRLAATSGEVLEAIVRLVEQTADHVRDIAAAAEQQSAASDEIAVATEHISNSAAENAHAMQESAVAVSELARMASDLKAIIAEMKAEAADSCDS